jgi:hypothetical protein
MSHTELMLERCEHQGRAWMRALIVEVQDSTDDEPGCISVTAGWETNGMAPRQLAWLRKQVQEHPYACWGFEDAWEAALANTHARRRRRHAHAAAAPRVAGMITIDELRTARLSLSKGDRWINRICVMTDPVFDGWLENEEFEKVHFYTVDGRLCYILEKVDRWQVTRFEYDWSHPRVSSKTTLADAEQALIDEVPA